MRRWQVCLIVTVVIALSGCPEFAGYGDSGDSGTSPRPDATLLDGLTVSSATLSPDFDPTVLTYRVSVDHSVDQVTAQATPRHADARVTITPGPPVPLPVGANVVTVVVSALADEPSTTYQITVTRDEAPEGARLDSLTVSSGTLFPAFDPTVTSYTVTVGADTTQSSAQATTSLPGDTDRSRGSA